jgi:serine/threonine protein kinase
MLRAVGYLHGHGVVHRDLKLENFLYESESDDAQLKLIDFGFAKLWDQTTLMMASCGSIAYVSPDVLKGIGYTNKCDMWSLGVIIWMLLVGYPPFHGDEKSMIAKIKAGEADWRHKKRWKLVSPDAVDLIEKLLLKDPASRIDAQQA